MNLPPPRNRQCKTSWSWGWRSRKGFLFLPFKQKRHVKPWSTFLPHMRNFQDIYSKERTPGSRIRWGFLCSSLPDLLLFQGPLSHYLILLSMAKVVLGCPQFQAQILSRLQSSLNSVLKFQFGPCLSMKPDQPIQSYPQARQPLRKLHSPALLMDKFLGSSLWRCCLKLQERTRKRKQVTELYAYFTI